MNTLFLKLILTPALIGTASLAGRRWGPAVSGWLVGLPLTSGPVAFFLALNEGVDFASAAAIGTMAGTTSQAVFSLAYAWVGARYHWGWAFLAGTLAFAVATILLQSVALPIALFFGLVLLSLVIGLRLLPSGSDAQEANTTPLPRWDIPARMVVATVVVVTITGLASQLGPRLTGLLTPFPIYATVLTVFAHRQQGAASAVTVLRGLLFGLFGFAGFFFVLAVSLVKLGTAPAFFLALLTTLAFQAGSLWLIRRKSNLTPS